MPTSTEAVLTSRPAVAPLTERALTFLLSALIALTALSIDMSLPAMPQMQRAFNAGPALVQLTLSMFLIGFAAGQLVAGPLSDRIGRKPVLLGGLGLFALSGFLCAASPTLPLLVASRFLQGMGACVGPVIARAIVRDRFEGHQAASVLSQITQVMIAAPLIAPTLGGYVLVVWGWPSIFLLLAAFGLVVWTVSRFRLPETGTLHGTEQPAVWQGFREVLTHPVSLRHTLATCFTHAGMFAYISGSPFLFIEVFGIPRERFGLFFAATAAALMVGATVNRMLLPRAGGARLLRAGLLVVLVAGLSLAALAWLRVGGLAGVIGPMVLYLFGLGLVQPNATAAAMAPHGKLAGVSSSVIGAMQTIGGALAGFGVGAFYDHTPRALAGTVAVMAVLAYLVRDRSEDPG